MGAAQTDIVARLQLRAEQFSSEGGRAFAQMAANAKTAANDVRSSFGQSFAEVQKLAEQSLKMPRTASGSIDLSGEIALLRQAAMAADQKAAATRELSAAMLTASSSERTVTEAMRLEADAAMVSARSEEANASAIRQRILALEAVQVELNKNTGVVNAHTRAANDNTVSAGQQRQSMMMLGQQVQDFSVQAANGGSVLTAFSQQVGQAGYALNGMGGRLGAVGDFLGTFTGSVVLVALTVLPALIAKVLEQNNALDDAVDKLKKDAVESAITAKAKELFAHSTEGLTAAIREQIAAQTKAIEAERTATENANINARANFREAMSIRDKTRARLEDAIAQEEIDRKRAQAPGQRGELGTLALDVSSSRVAGLQAQLAANADAVAAARTAYNNSQVDLAQEQAKRNSDPLARINRLYDDQARAARNAARGNAELTRGLYAQLSVIEANRKAAVKAEQDRQAAANRRAPALGSQLTAEQGGRILQSAQTFVGNRENTLSGKSTLKDLFGTAGISIDPEKTAWCAAFINAVLAGQGIKGSGSLAARSFLGYGTATNRPEKGDIVVLRTGKTQEHVGFYAGQGANGRVLVTGGNQSGGQVSTTSFPRSAVEAFRRAPTASAEYAASLRDQKKASQDAEREQRELEAAYGRVADRLDPVTEAVRRYHQTLADLDKLSGGPERILPDLSDPGKAAAPKPAARISEEQRTSLAVAAGQDLGEALQKAASENFRNIIGPDDVSQFNDLFAGAAEKTGDYLRPELEQAAFLVGDRLRSAVSGIFDLFDIRISGPLNGPLRGLLQPGGFEQQGRDIADTLTGGLKNLGLKISDESLERLTGKIGNAVTAAAYGDLGGSAFASITGGKQSKLGSSLGGVLGNEAGKELGGAISKAVGGSLGKALGGAAGPFGAIAGGVLGNVIGSLFAKTEKSSATLSAGAGGLSVGTASGTSDQLKSVATSEANSVLAALTQIADAVGGSISGSGSVSIGTKNGKYVVDASGLGRTNYGKSGDGITSYKTQEEAVAAATRAMLDKGVIAGISQASQKIIKSGQDLSTAIQKAALIEAVPKDLKAMLDPVGAAVDELNLKFQKTVAALKEGGATAEQMAQAQRLYDLQLEQVKASTASASQSLKDFLTGLKLGSSSPYSLRDQEATALSALKPYLDQIAAGQSIDQAKYQAAAQSYLDVERQMYGSTQAYFDAIDAVQAATNKAISTIDNAVPIGTSVESPFVKATADSTAKTADAVQTGNEIASQNSDLLERMTVALEKLVANGGSVDSSFIGAVRSFASAA